MISRTWLESSSHLGLVWVEGTLREWAIAKDGRVFFHGTPHKNFLDNEVKDGKCITCQKEFPDFIKLALTIG